LVPAITAGVLAIFGFSSQRVTGSRTFAFAMLAVLAWSLSYAAELSSVNLEAQQFWLSLEYLGVATIPVLWLLLALLYSAKDRFVTARNVILLLILPIITIVLVATNPYHHLVYTTVSLDATEPFPIMSLTRGVWYWVNAIYAYIVIVAGIVLLLERLTHPRDMYRKQVIVMLAGLIVPWLCNMIYQVSNFQFFYHIDLTPYGFAVTGVVIAWAMYRYQLFSMAPVARDSVIENMDDSMIVIDRMDRVVDANRSAHRLLGWAESAIGKPAGAMLARWPALLEVSRTPGTVMAELPRNDKVAGSKCYDVSAFDFSDRKGKNVGKVIMLHDISDRKQMEDDLKENEEKYHSFFRTTRDAVFMTTTDGHWLEVNEAAAEMFGYENIEELKKISVVDVYNRSEQASEFTDAISARGFVKDLPVTFKRKSGQLIDALLTAVTLRDHSGNITGFQGTVKDITEIKRIQEALIEANQQLQGSLLSAERQNREITLLGEMAQAIQGSHAMDAAYSGAVAYLGKLFEGDNGFIAEITDDGGTVTVKASFGKPKSPTTFAAADCFALRKMQAYETDGRDPSTVCPHLGKFRGCNISVPLIAPGGPSWLLELQHGREDLNTVEACRRWLDERRPLMFSTAQELSVALSNIRLKETLHDQAIRDALTGLYNRRYMEEMLDQQLRRAKRSRSSIGFIMADLDFFKKFNDSHGHAAGDLLLTAVANRIRNVIRLEDIACRYGGEEFLIILPDAGPKVSFARAQQMREQIKDISFDYEGTQLGGVTISMGVAAFPDNGEDGLTLTKAADAAMYEAKKGGRDRVIMALRQGPA
jgi:diguanylate cyclase (GGDEF)-like protein/PAS domain S-box-containing protein